MKVSQKLLSVGIGIILLTSFSIYFISEYQTGLIENTFTQSKITSEIFRKNVEANVAFNNFQLYDIFIEEYYEEGISSSLNDYKKLYNEMIALISDFSEVYTEEKEQEIESELKSLLHNLDSSVDTLVEAYNVLGFNDYGLENRFSLNRDKMEDDFTILNSLPYELDMEYIRVQEMKFIHRKNDKYIGKVSSALEETLVYVEEKEAFKQVTADYISSMYNYRDQYILIGLTADEGLRGKLKSNLSALEVFFKKLSSESEQAMIIASKNKTIFDLLTITLGIIFGSVIFILLARHVTGPLHLLSVKASLMAEGDLTAEIPEKLTGRKDEIGLLASALNSTIENLQNTVQEIKSSSYESSLVGETLHESANQTSGSMETVKGKLEGFTELFGDLDRNIIRSNEASEQIIEKNSLLDSHIAGQVTAVEQTSAIIEEMSASLNSIAGITTEKNIISTDLVKLTREGDERVRETNTIIQEISQNMDQMKDLTSLINGIASQTNLLSMNAAIEAAHAGDAGKGFGVVAEEIRKLSEGTADAVKGIAKYLKSVIARIDKALVVSENSGKAFAKVNTGVAGNADAFRTITDMISEVSTGSHDMLIAMTQINQVTKDVQANADDIKGIITELGEEMKAVSQLSTRGTIEINDSLEEIKKIDKNTSKVAELSGANERIIDRLTELVKQFKLP